jgi:hypothetical protein
MDYLMITNSIGKLLICYNYSFFILVNSIGAMLRQHNLESRVRQFLEKKDPSQDIDENQIFNDHEFSTRKHRVNMFTYSAIVDASIDASVDTSIDWVCKLVEADSGAEYVNYP